MGKDANGDLLKVDDSENMTDDEEDDDDDMVTMANVTLPENIYSLALVSLVRDLEFICDGKRVWLRIARMLVAQVFASMIFFLQAYLLLMAKLYVTAEHVDNIRDTYSQYEAKMYHAEMPGHTELTANGRQRGIPEYFDGEAFHDLKDDLKEKVCSISMSHPHFFMVILLIWTLTCIGEVKMCFENMICILVYTPTVRSMSIALASKDYSPIDDASLRAMNPKVPDIFQRISALETNQRLVVGVTRGFKVYVTLVLILPRLAIVCILLWLGCRWLLSTVGFEEMLLNTVALEFILLLKELLYSTVVPARNRLDVNNTVFLPHKSYKRASPVGFFGLFSWFFVAVAWIYLYVHVFQTVLPSYRWDVRGTCTEWSAQKDQRTG